MPARYFVSSMKRVLVFGDNDWLDIYVLQGLLERGHQVAMLSSDSGELARIPGVEYIRRDPLTNEGIGTALKTQHFDVVVATAEDGGDLAGTLAGRTDQFISISRTPLPDVSVTGVSPDTDGAVASTRDETSRVAPVGRRDLEEGPTTSTEKYVFDLHNQGAFDASVFRCPLIYGPRNPHPREWSTLCRILDGREFIILPNGGLQVHSRVSGWNASHALLLAVDNPAAASGHLFNVADEDQFSLRQWTEMTMSYCGDTLRLVSVPHGVFHPDSPSTAYRSGGTHMIFDTTKIREQLGFSDTKPASVGLQETVPWLIAHRHLASTWPIRDSFDYGAEDRFVASWSHVVDNLDDVVDRWTHLSMPLPQSAKGSQSGTGPASG